MYRYRFLTRQRWSENLGRKAPPLRASLCFPAYYEWLKKCYGFQAKNLFITFSRLESGNINSDTFVNEKEKNKLVDILLKTIKHDPRKTDKELDYLKKISLDLVRTSRQLKFKKLPLKQRLNTFYRSWEKFSPAYYHPIFLQASLEEIILVAYKRRPKIYPEVLAFIGSGFKSKSFKINAGVRSSKYKFRKKEGVFLKLLKKLAEIRDIRQHCRDTAWKQSKPFFEELGERTRLGKDVIRTTPANINKALEAPKIHKRFPPHSLVYNLKGVRIDYSRDLTKIKKLVWPAKPHANQIKGVVAHAGIVVGRIRRIMYYDKKIILPGEILLTKMTTPGFVPLLPICAGIITDVGGATCHAAILAREFKKPCVIGTNHATDLLKTGDLVQVDANRGIIKKLQ